MKFKDGEDAGKKCKKCGADMVFEMSFRDCFSYTTGHYTTDLPLIVCPKCDEAEEFEDWEEQDETGNK